MVQCCFTLRNILYLPTAFTIHHLRGKTAHFRPRLPHSPNAHHSCCNEGINFLYPGTTGSQSLYHTNFSAFLQTVQRTAHMSQPHTARFSSLRLRWTKNTSRCCSSPIASIILFFSSAISLAQTASLQRILSENENPGSKDRPRNLGRFRQEQDRSRNNWANNQCITSNTM